MTQTAMKHKVSTRRTGEKSRKCVTSTLQELSARSPFFFDKKHETHQRKEPLVPGRSGVPRRKGISCSLPCASWRLALYNYYDEAGVKRDAGGALRVAILGALLPLADPGDRALAERAVATYEFLPP